MEQQRLGIGVVEQVDELVFEVAVVHVHGDAAHLERGVDAFGVLVAVVHVRRDLRVRPEAGGGEARRRGGRRARRTAPKVTRRSPWISAVRSGIASHTDSKTSARFQLHRRRSLRARADQVRSSPWYPRTGGQQHIPRPPSFRPGRPGAVGRTRRRSSPASRSTESAPRLAVLPPGAAPVPRVVGSVDAAVLVPLVRSRRRRPRRAHQAARDDAIAPGRDRVSGRQVRRRARPRPAGHRAPRGARGSGPRAGRRRNRRAPRRHRAPWRRASRSRRSSGFSRSGRCCSRIRVRSCACSRFRCRRSSPTACIARSVGTRGWTISTCTSTSSRTRPCGARPRASSRASSAHLTAER